MDNLLDIYIGKKIKTRRTMLGISQKMLGEALRVTFQQIQKYEKGINSISASKLFILAEYLKVEVEYFFEGYNEEYEIPTNNGHVSLHENEEALEYEHEKLSDKEVLSLMKSFSTIGDKQVRRKINDLIKSLSTSQ